ncbi:MAG: hypothetical protein QM817_05440 [Archangium sp.]
MQRLLAALAVLSFATGCILGPTDDQRVSSTTAPLTFEGFHLNGSGQVQLKAWNYSTNAMTNLGLPVTASATPSYTLDRDIFGWSATRTLGPAFWRAGPVSGQCAVIGGTTVVSGTTYNLYTFEQDWASCFGANPTVGGFVANCASNHSPVANLYTSDWNARNVTASMLNTTATLASALITINLDNFTPNPYEFCSAATPAGCPNGDGSDPETWKFFAPNASFIRQAMVGSAGGTMNFSINPSRSGPSTVYIDNMRSSTLGLRVEGSDFILRIAFEAAGVEIRTNCIRDILCAAVDGQSIDFTAPVAEIRFRLAVVNDKVVYTSAVTSFSSGIGATDAENSIATAITEKLTTDASIHASVNDALDALIRNAAGFGNFPVDTITPSGTGLIVRPACVRD